MITIDGSYGEGGGQVLRTSLSLSVLTGQPVLLERIRAGRRKPGLQAQHLTGVLAAARLCDAELEGARLHSTVLNFSPRRPPQPGEYRFDVAEQRKGGSAGSVSLVLHTVLLPLAWAAGESKVTVRGGTHVAWSPPFQHLERVYLGMLRKMGVAGRAKVARYGWYPKGGGEVTAWVSGVPERTLSPLQLSERGKLRKLWGLSAYSDLPAHVGERQRRRAEQVLREAGLRPRFEVLRAPSRGIGTAVVLVAECDEVVAGFGALGRRGKPAEQVAEEACGEFLRWWRSGAAVEMHLADQLILPLALAAGPSTFTTCRLTQHLLTNAWVVQQFLPVQIEVEGEEGGPGAVHVRPA
jgi:RNA 3'-terminal phosphate cyclase (ATP)